MKKGLLMAMLIATLTGCSKDIDEKVTDQQENVIEQTTSQEEKIELENRYADCTVETCSQEMLAERYYKVKTTKDDYFGESIDIAQALLDLYGITAHQDIHKLQESIIVDEEFIADDNNFFDVKDYIDDVTGCLGQCESKFISYEEATSLEFDEALALVRTNSGSYEVGSSPINHDLVTDSSSSTSDLDTTKGTCKEINGKYTSQGLSVIDCSYNSSKDKISITVQNNSGVDLRYIEVEIYGISSSGQTISSDYTNHGSTIRDGAIQTLETYVDYANSYEVEITEARIKY